MADKLKSVSYFQGLINELLENDKKRNELFEGIDKMVHNDWKFSDTFKKAAEDIYEVVDSTPSDAITSGAIALSGTVPKWQVIPHNDNPAEYDRVERIEEVIRWHYRKADRRGIGTILYDKAISSLRYNMICTKVEDLKHILPQDSSKWTSLQRRAWTDGRFLMRVFNPKGIHLEITSLGVSTIVHVENFPVMDVIRHWELYDNNDSDEGKRIQQTLSDMKARIGDRYPRELRFIQYYAINDDQILTFGHLESGPKPAKQGLELPPSPISYTQAQGTPDVANADSAEFVFVNMPNPYNFMPWSIRIGGSRVEDAVQYQLNPLLAPLYFSGSWEKLNMAKSFVFSEPLRRIREPREVSETRSGEGPDVDFERGNLVELSLGERFQRLPPTTMDPQAMQVIQAMEAGINRTTGSSVLGDVLNVSTHTTFATYSAMIKVALSKLDTNRDALGHSCTDDALLFLWWGDFTKEPLTSYAQSSVMGRMSGFDTPVGRQISVSPDDYDVNSLDILCDILPKVPTDMMEQLNAAVILSNQMHVPINYLLEHYIHIPPEQLSYLYDQYTTEFLQNAELQAHAQSIMMQAQFETQQEEQQGNQPGNQGPQSALGPGAGASQASFGNMSGPGFNPAMGGTSPARGAPGMTGTALNPRNNYQAGGQNQ
jgi:hypothetical protein